MEEDCMQIAQRRERETAALRLSANERIGRRPPGSCLQRVMNIPDMKILKGRHLMT